MHTSSDFREEREELERLLASGFLSRSPSLVQFVRYICQKYFDGEIHQIKEYNVAVEALGRSADFDQKRDSIVRVEAHRLRKRLQEFYAQEGCSHPIRIELPPGSYAPVFRRTEIFEVEPMQLQPVADQPHKIAENRVTSDRLRVWVAASILCVLTAAALIYQRSVSGSEFPESRARLAAVVPVTSPVVGSDGEFRDIRILAGTSNRIVDRFGNVWLADRFFTGGEIFAAGNKTIQRTQDPSLFLNRRQGNFSYDVPLKGGPFELRLYFAETVFGDTNIAGGGETSRIFSVEMNGKRILDNVDILADAGGGNIADIKVFKDVTPAPDGFLHLKFAPSYKETAFINAIEIVPGIAGKILPIRIAARDSAFADAAGQIWLADRFFQGGVLVQRHDPIPGTTDEEIYRGERFGNFSYAIPVAEKSHYTLRLRFCENWFGDGRTGGGGAESRVFDIYCNGRALIRNLDVYREAGGSLRPLDKTFKNLEPNAQGKLILTFVPVRNYALVNAIEVIDEGR
jgi:hypothetical protein